MNISDLLAKLKKVKKNSNGWIALCPAHEDKKESLSITEDNGKILMNCFRGCDFGEIVSAVGIEMKDLFNDSNNSVAKSMGEIKDIYPYHNENGELLYENLRYEPKTFLQRHFDNNGNAVWNLKGIQRVPYCLPEIIKAVNEEIDIWLCEGEKDADNLRRLGLVASSFKNWKKEFNVYIKGARIILFVDHDEPGIKQSAATAKLIYPDVVSLKLIDLFENKPIPQSNGKDVSDFINSLANKNEFSDEEIAESLCITADNTDDWQLTDEDFGNLTNSTSDESSSIFTTKKTNNWIEEAKDQPMPKMLFDEFWFEGEICILFADTGKGKSTLAVQVADSISSGKGIQGFSLEADKQIVLYFDFELSAKQLEKRYSIIKDDHFENHYIFDSNFKRAEINPYSIIPESFKDFEKYLNFSLEHEIKKSGAKIVIVDNITYLKEGTETAKDALPLMKELIRLKKKYNLSIMVLAHTPKRNLARPLTVNDLQGSKMLSNFADSIVAIGESSKDKNLRYLKQIKARSTEQIYHADNVALFQLIKPENFLKFDFIGFGREREHLNQITDDNKAEMIGKAKDLSKLGESQRHIAEKLGIALGTVNKYLKM